MDQHSWSDHQVAPDLIGRDSGTDPPRDGADIENLVLLPFEVIEDGKDREGLEPRYPVHAAKPQVGDGHLDLVLANGSHRTTCWVGSTFSCGGHPKDDDETYAFRARLIE